MTVNKTSEAVEMTISLLKTINLPVGMIKTEGEKFLIAINNLELIAKSVKEIEGALDSISDKAKAEPPEADEEKTE